jgi:hypothetical protein
MIDEPSHSRVCSLPCAVDDTFARLSTRHELEQALRTAWSAETLAVYGDHLQRLGDPRGELVALDLAPVPEDDAWRARRHELVVAWLGEESAERWEHLVQHGFVHAVRAGEHPGYEWTRRSRP